MAFPARIKPHVQCDNIFEDIDLVAERRAIEVSLPGLSNANPLFVLETQKPLGKPLTGSSKAGARECR